MSAPVRAARSAHRLIRDPLAPVRGILATEDVGSRLTPDLAWLSAEPLRGLPARTGAEAPADGAGDGSGAASGPASGTIGGRGGERKRRRSDLGGRRADVEMGRPPRDRPPAPRSDRNPWPAERRETAPGGGRLRALEGGGGGAGGGGFTAEGPKKLPAPGRVMSLRRNEAGPSLPAGGARSGRVPRSTNDVGAAGIPRDPPPGSPEPARGRESGAAPDAPARPARTRPHRNGGSAPELRSALQRIAIRVEAAIGRHEAAPEMAPASPLGESRSAPAAGRARADVADAGTPWPPPVVTRPGEAAGTGPFTNRPAAAELDPTWILDIVEDALRDQARREGIDLL